MTTQAVETEEHPPLEGKAATWAEFLRDLMPWQLHKLMNMGEMNAHDDFVNGTTSLQDIYALLLDEKDEQREYSVKV